VPVHIGWQDVFFHHRGIADSPNRREQYIAHPGLRSSIGFVLL
jgi:hypothetical protein